MDMVDLISKVFAGYVMILCFLAPVIAFFGFIVLLHKISGGRGGSRGGDRGGGSGRDRGSGGGSSIRGSGGCYSGGSSGGGGGSRGP